MNLPFFIAKRVAADGKQSFSALIIRIATTAVALSVAVMIIATAMVSGFKHTIRDKIFGFWGHIHITNFDANNSFETTPIDMRQPFYPNIDTIGAITYLKENQLFGYEWTKETETKAGIRHIQMYAGKAGIIKADNSLEGIVLKGIGKDFDWQFLKKYLVQGDTLSLQNWEFVPKYLNGDSLMLADTLISNKIIISETTSKRLRLQVDDSFTVHFVAGNVQRVRKFTVGGIYKTGLEEYDKKFALVDIRQVQQLNDWQPNQITGFEVFLENIDDLDPFGEYVYYNLTNNNLFSQTIKEVYPNIFGWLGLQDINEKFILLLMLIVSVINMTTALMILILERTNMIGTLKALGGTNRTIQQIFLYYAGLIIGKGLLWGNIIGLTVCFIQKYFKIIRLDEAAYYVSVAPVELNFLTILLLNLGTLSITLLVLLIPSLLVATISPIKAVQFK